MKKGIDVSYAQGNIDFSKINKNQVQFVIIRSSFGWEADQKDNQFERNYSGFKKLGIPVGAYHYSYAKTKEQAVKEAKYCLECIKGKSFDLPVFIDMEEQSCAAAGKRGPASLPPHRLSRRFPTTVRQKALDRPASC